MAHLYDLIKVNHDPLACRPEGRCRVEEGGHPAVSEVAGRVALVHRVGHHVPLSVGDDQTAARRTDWSGEKNIFI